MNRLFDILFRQHAYVEGVKAGFSRDYVDVLRKLYQVITVALLRSRYTSLDQYTKNELSRLIQRVQAEQSSLYYAYIKYLIDSLKQFLAVDLDVTNAVYEAVAPEPDPNPSPIYGAATLGNLERLWASVAGEPNAANGLLLYSQVNTFANAAMASVVAALRQGYANNWTMQEALKEIAGDSTNRFKDGLFARLGQQNKGIVDTILQHVNASVQSGVASETLKEYRWVSVLDNRTTPICLKRDGAIYTYGEGPLPPAHYNCRSHTVPVTNDKEPDPESFFQWVTSQPLAFQNDLFGDSLAGRVRANEFNANTVSRLAKPITVAQFAKKIKLILN